MTFQLRSRIFVTLVVALFSATSLWAQTLPKVDVYKSASCGCCGKWIAHLQKNGFKVDIHDVDNIPAARAKLGMPDKFGSCHSAKVGDYAVEGHVPATDIKQLLNQKPKALGLAVPSMPPGAPGMDIANSPPNASVLVQADGSSRIYAQH